VRLFATLEYSASGPLLQLWSGSMSSSFKVVPLQHLFPSSSCIPKYLGLHQEAIRVLLAGEPYLFANNDLFLY
jgi:hypothetical protein